MFTVFYFLSALPKGYEAKNAHDHAEDNGSDRVWAPLSLVACLEGRGRHHVEERIFGRGIVHRARGRSHDGSYKAYVSENIYGAFGKKSNQARPTFCTTVRCEGYRSRTQPSKSFAIGSVTWTSCVDCMYPAHKYK